jgi:hypothetical protein
MVVIGNFRSRAELRKSPRRQMHYNAAIAIAGDNQPHLCRIVDISNTGARLQLEEDCELPYRFLLLLTKGGRHGVVATSYGATALLLASGSRAHRRIKMATVARASV